MMASRRVTRYLEDLHSQYVNDALDAPKAAEQIIQNLRDVVLTPNQSTEQQSYKSAFSGFDDGIFPLIPHRFVH